MTARTNFEKIPTNLFLRPYVDCLLKHQLGYFPKSSIFIGFCVHSKKPLLKAGEASFPTCKTFKSLFTDLQTVRPNFRCNTRGHRASPLNEVWPVLANMPTWWYVSRCHVTSKSVDKYGHIYVHHIFQRAISFYVLFLLPNSSEFQLYPVTTRLASILTLSTGLLSQDGYSKFMICVWFIFVENDVEWKYRERFLDMRMYNSSWSWLALDTVRILFCLPRVLFLSCYRCDFKELVSFRANCAIACKFFLAHSHWADWRFLTTHRIVEVRFHHYYVLGVGKSRRGYIRW